jgi:hypothetical protein
MFEDMNEINDLMGRSYASPDGIDEVPLKISSSTFITILIFF